MNPLDLFYFLYTNVIRPLLPKNGHISDTALNELKNLYLEEGREIRDSEFHFVCGISFFVLGKPQMAIMAFNRARMLFVNTPPSEPQVRYYSCTLLAYARLFEITQDRNQAERLYTEFEQLEREISDSEEGDSEGKQHLRAIVCFVKAIALRRMDYPTKAWECLGEAESMASDHKLIEKIKRERAIVRKLMERA